MRWNPSYILTTLAYVAMPLAAFPTANRIGGSVKEVKDLHCPEQSQSCFTERYNLIWAF